MRRVLEYMIISFLRALDTIDGDYQGIHRLLATSLDTEITLEPDTDSVQYCVQMINRQVDVSDRPLSPRLLNSKLKVLAVICELLNHPWFGQSCSL